MSRIMYPKNYLSQRELIKIMKAKYTAEPPTP